MSHPVPGHTYGENEYKHDDSDTLKPTARMKALHKKIEGKKKKSVSVKDLRAMISRPASKEWFAKYGNPQKKYSRK